MGRKVRRGGRRARRRRLSVQHRPSSGAAEEGRRLSRMERGSKSSSFPLAGRHRAGQAGYANHRAGCRRAARRILALPVGRNSDKMIKQVEEPLDPPSAEARPKRLATVRRLSCALCGRSNPGGLQRRFGDAGNALAAVPPRSWMDPAAQGRICSMSPTRIRGSPTSTRFRRETRRSDHRFRSAGGHVHRFQGRYLDCELGGKTDRRVRTRRERPTDDARRSPRLPARLRRRSGDRRSRRCQQQLAIGTRRRRGDLQRRHRHADALSGLEHFLLPRVRVRQGRKSLRQRNELPIARDFKLAELPKGGNGLSAITLAGATIEELGGIQWDGNYLAIDEGNYRSRVPRSSTTYGLQARPLTSKA